MSGRSPSRRGATRTCRSPVCRTPRSTSPTASHRLAGPLRATDEGQGVVGGDPVGAGNQNVQIHDVSGSTIHITYDGQRRSVPLEPAVVAVGSGCGRRPGWSAPARGWCPSSPAPACWRTSRTGLRTNEAFAGCVIGGRGGTGKTRLGVELCGRARAAGWLCGLLARSADQAALEALVEVPTPRLVVIDYAETRVEQLEVVLPRWRPGPAPSTRCGCCCWCGPRPGGAATGPRPCAVGATCSTRCSTTWRFGCSRTSRSSPSSARRCSAAAAGAFATRARLTATSVPKGRAVRLQATFASPLLVVVAAYLAVHGDRRPAGHPRRAARGAGRARGPLLAGHRRGLGTDEALRRRVVALATLAGADGEGEAVGLLRLVPDLADANAERRGRLARWAHDLYPGPRWWNPLEPDLAGRAPGGHLLRRGPAGARRRPGPARPPAVVQPLDTYARAAPDHPQLAGGPSPGAPEGSGASARRRSTRWRRRPTSPCSSATPRWPARSSAP